MPGIWTRVVSRAGRQLTQLVARLSKSIDSNFDYHLPHEHRPAARLARTTPLYPELDRQYCHWGVVNGWERALFFKPSPEFEDEHSYRYTSTHDVIAREIQGIVNSVGLMEVSGFNRYEIRDLGLVSLWTV